MLVTTIGSQKHFVTNFQGDYVHDMLRISQIFKSLSHKNQIIDFYHPHKFKTTY
jgi:hypothetical protein